MGKKVIVTGGSRGIGKAIVQQLASEGWEVVFNYRESAAAAEAIVKDIVDNGGKAACYKCDISNFDECTSFIASAKEFLGDVDALVNNAGITRDTSLFLMQPAQWHDVIDTNLTGYFNITRNLITYFMKNKKGAIINITSVSGFTGIVGQTNYCASKAGIIGFTRALAKEVAKLQIPVNCIAPGFIESDMTAGLGEKHIDEIKALVPMKRLGKAEEVAQLASFLLSGKTPYITGQVITIDGGLTV